MISEDSYKNPFVDYNANVMDNSKILEYWCTPKTSGLDFFSDAMPIFFMGGRGTGKTMFLKYFSYYVQRDEALRDKKTVLSHLQNKGGIGFYIRFDGPVLRSFNGKIIKKEIWDILFTHYFELQVCKAYIEVINDLVRMNELNDKQVKMFISEFNNLMEISENTPKTISEAFKFVETKIKEINRYRSNIAFSDVKFNGRVFSSQELSFGVAKIAMHTIEPFGKLLFAIMIDEYENFDNNQQRIVNTLIKFVQNGITFRIGLRLEGLRTNDTISDNEFLKETRDYSKLIFENFITSLNNEKKYKDFLYNVAKKRLEAVPILKKKKFIDISQIFGDVENPEDEAFEIAKGEKRHFELLKNASLDSPIKELVEILSYPQNPLFEMLNILWVIRGWKPEDVKKAMNDFIKGLISEDSKKYKNDYTNKYKLSLLFLLASQYRKNKKYYSFNTLCRLSSGIVGNFIELCRRAFQLAYFEDLQELIDNGRISKDVQNRAAIDLADTQFEDIKKIKKHGEYIYRMAKNLGNVFSKYHKDPLIRYPETNQFTVDISLIEEDYKKIFLSAIEWSVIQRKSGLQQQSPGRKKENIYTLNRIYSPSFQISYRTRGGYNESYNSADIKSILTSDNFKPQMKLIAGNSKKMEVESMQMKFEL